jgi:hypothetical protein
LVQKVFTCIFKNRAKINLHKKMALCILQPAGLDFTLDFSDLPPSFFLLLKGKFFSSPAKQTGDAQPVALDYLM